MKKIYDFIEVDYKARYKILKLEETLFKKMTRIKADFAIFSVDSMSDDLLRIFLQPSQERFFTTQQLDELKDIMNYHFKIPNPPVPDELPDWKRSRYFWARDIREEIGFIYWSRHITDYKKDIDLIIIIDNAPVDNCKLIPKEITKTVYEMECN